MDVGRDYRRTGPDRRAAALPQTLQAAPAGQWRQNGRQHAALKASGRPETGPGAQQEAPIESAHVHPQPFAPMGMAPDEDPTPPSGFAPDGPRVVPPVRSAGAAIAGRARHEGAAGCRRRPRWARPFQRRRPFRSGSDTSLRNPCGFKSNPIFVLGYPLSATTSFTSAPGWTADTSSRAIRNVWSIVFVSPASAPCTGTAGGHCAFGFWPQGPPVSVRTSGRLEGV